MMNMSDQSPQRLLTFGPDVPLHCNSVFLTCHSDKNGALNKSSSFGHKHNTFVCFIFRKVFI